MKKETSEKRPLRPKEKEEEKEVKTIYKISYNLYIRTKKKKKKKPHLKRSPHGEREKIFVRKERRRKRQTEDKRINRQSEPTLLPG